LLKNEERKTSSGMHTTYFFAMIGIVADNQRTASDSSFVLVARWRFKNADIDQRRDVKPLVE
jgi:hypothetical protein